MSDESNSTERNRNLWAPWRMEYIDTLSTPAGGCFLCNHRDNPADDEKNLVLWRGKRCFAVLNRFPYTGGHALVSPMDHVPSFTDLDDTTMVELMRMVCDVQRAQGQALKAEGFNIGVNIGRCAGAGLPGHLHVHIVPRWGGDTNFMPVFGQVRVIPQFLQTLRQQICDAARQLGIVQ